MNKKYFQLTQNNNEVDIQIYGDITSWEWLESDVSSYTLSKQIEELECDQINVYINSYGGEVAEGLAIYNQLKRHKAKVKTVCDGFACSAASVVFMAGDERITSTASLLMIHNAWTRVKGNSKELRKQADETWITPQEAIEKGFITAIVNEKEAEEVSQSVKKSLMKLILNAKKEDDLNTEINNSEENKSKEPEEHTKCSFFNEFKNKLNRKGGQQ